MAPQNLDAVLEAWKSAPPSEKQKAEVEEVGSDIKKAASISAGVLWAIFGVVLAVGIVMLAAGAALLGKAEKEKKAGVVGVSIAGAIILIVFGILFVLGSIAPGVAAGATTTVASNS